MSTLPTNLHLQDSRDPHVQVGIEVIRKLQAAGHQALFAGGCVRDWLLGLRTPKDIDVATSAGPEEVRAVFPHAKAVGEAFGVMLVRRRRFEFEIATFRSDMTYRDGRRPEAVELHDSPEVDAKRRDFSINGIFYDPLAERVLDYVDGLADLEAGHVRAIGEPAHRFGEDHLRLLRAVRFAARFGFEIEPHTWEALGELAPKLALIAPERIKMELDTILRGPRPDWAMDAMQQAGLMRAVLPEVAALDGLPHASPHHPEGDVFTHVLRMLKQMRADTEALEAQGHERAASGDEAESDGSEPEETDSEPWRCLPSEGPLLGAKPATTTLAWAVLMHDAAKATTFDYGKTGHPHFYGHDRAGAELAEAVAERLRFSNEERHRVHELVRLHMRFLHIREMRASTLKRFLREPHFDEHLALHRLDCLSSGRDLSGLRFALDKLYEYAAATSAESLRPPPLLTGNDLKQLGYKPGPRFKEMLTWLEEQQLEGQLTERNAAIAALREAFPL